MRTLFILTLTVMLWAGGVAAQVVDGVPRLINYQGVLTDTDGNPVADGEYEVTFTIWRDSTSTSSGDRAWISPACTVLVINGLFNWQLGSKENLPPWTTANDPDMWLGVQVDPDPEMAPRTRLTSVAYAFKAWQADYAGYADSAGYAITVSMPTVVTGAFNGTTHGVSGLVTGWFDVGHAAVFSSPPVVFVEVCDPSTGETKHGDVASATQSSFDVTVMESVGGALVLSTSVDVRYIAIGE